VLSVAYVGTRALHLGMTRLPNGGAAFPANTPRPAAATLAPNDEAYGSGVINFLETGASSNYHGLQVQLNGRLAKGLNLRNSYTWSKAMDDISTDAQNFVSESNRRLDRAVSDFDVRHHFSSALIYALPFDDRLPQGARRWLGGWQTSAIVTFRTGLPFSILSGPPTPNGVSNNRINNVADTIIRQPGAFRTLLPASGLNLNARDPNFIGTRVIPGYVSGSGNFNAPMAIGTLGRNTERGDRYSDVSFG
jgi:hypothetical protein